MFTLRFQSCDSFMRISEKLFNFVPILKFACILKNKFMPDFQQNQKVLFALKKTEERIFFSRLKLTLFVIMALKKIICNIYTTIYAKFNIIFVFFIIITDHHYFEEDRHWINN